MCLVDLRSLLHDGVENREIPPEKMKTEMTLFQIQLSEQDLSSSNIVTYLHSRLMTSMCLSKFLSKLLGFLWVLQFFFLGNDAWDCGFVVQFVLGAPKRS